MTRIEELMADLQKQYLAEYAYPTSDTASTYRMSRTGCWFVSQRNGVEPRIAVSSHGYATKEEAQAVAEIMNHETEN